jgi:hypothetical protein
MANLKLSAPLLADADKIQFVKIVDLDTSWLLKRGIPCFDGLSMNGKLLMNSKKPPFSLSLVEG